MDLSLFIIFFFIHFDDLSLESYAYNSHEIIKLQSFLNEFLNKLCKASLNKTKKTQ